MVIISCSAFTFEEGAWTKVPKTVRTFANLILNNAPADWPKILGHSFFDLKLSYFLFLIFFRRPPTIVSPQSFHRITTCKFHPYTLVDCPWGKHIFEIWFLFTDPDIFFIIDRIFGWAMSSANPLSATAYLQTTIPLPQTPTRPSREYFPVSGM